MARGTMQRVASRACGRLFLAAVALGALAQAGPAVPGDPPLSLPADRVLDTAEDSPGAVVFSHTTHAALADNRCVTCHPQPFSILGRSAPISHAEMNAGRSCGTCHDGKSATGVADTQGCFNCHGVVEVQLAAGAASPGAVRFRHATHAHVPCSSCHPEPFAMRAGKTPLDKAAMYEGQTCGRCHDGRTAFSVEERCESCHAAEGADP